MDTLEFGSGQQESSSGPPLHYLQVCIVSTFHNTILNMMDLKLA